MTIGRALGFEGLLGKAALVLVVLMWFNFTVGILCVMEVRVSGTHQRNVRWLADGGTINHASITRIPHRAFRHSCTRFGCTGSSRTASITKPAAMSVLPFVLFGWGSEI